jgi:hypothetical protein
MANTKIYICDICESYIDPKRLHCLVISFHPGPEYNSITPAITTGSTGSAQREICPACAEKLYDDLSLGKNQAQLNSDLTRNFRLPEHLTKPVM